MNPVHGDVFYGHSIDTNVSKGASGANVTWNFSAVTQTSLDTISFLACDSTPYCSSFSGSNIAALTNGAYVYANAGSTKLSMNGYYSMGTAMVFSNPQDIMRYPFTYNSSYVDTSGYVLSSFGFVHTQIDSMVCDAYGTIQLPSGTDTGVIRVHVITHTTDSSSFGQSSSRTESYSWYKPGFHNLLFTINYDTSGSTSGTPYVSEAAYYTKKGGTTTAVSNVNSTATFLQAYPNPATDALHLKFELQNTSGALLTLTDVLGKTVASISGSDLKAGINDITYSVADIAPGLYIVRLQSSAGTVSQKVTITK